MAYNVQVITQIEYRTPICDSCVLYSSKSLCHRQSDMSTHSDESHAAKGCLLAMARLHDIAPLDAPDTIQVTWNPKADKVKPVLMLVAKEVA